jgi:hypothetical protein
MNVEITCPACNFSKTVSTDNIPSGVKWVICPGCKHRFEFTPPETEVESEQGSPWERRVDIGLWQAVYQTFVDVLFSPARFFRRMTTGKGIGEPMAIGLLFGSLGLMLSIFWVFVLDPGAISAYSDLLSPIPLTWLFLIAIILSPLLVLINMFFTSAIIHLLMRLLNNGKGGFEGTFRVMAFGQATKVLSLIPFIGGLTGWVWNVVIMVIGLREIHKTSHFRAIAVVAVSIVLKCLMLLPIFLLKSLFTSLGVLQ